MQCTAPVGSMLRAGRIPKVTTTTRMPMPEGVIGAVWAFCWGLAAASGTLVGGYFGANNAPPAPGHRLFHVGQTSQQRPSP